MFQLTPKHKGEFMIKPKHLKKGDRVAIVSLSRGLLGESWAIHKLNIAKERLEKDFGLEVVVMPNALKGVEYLYQHPEARASDLMEAFKDKSIKAIFNAIGGDDTIRLLPYIDFEVIKNNPKIFTGFSDTTVNHFMMHKAGLASYYGASVMNNFSEYVKINNYTKESIINTLLEPKSNLEIKPSKTESFKKDIVRWGEAKIHTARKFYPNKRGYEIISGKGKVKGELLGGCIETFVYLMGTPLWPTYEEWKGKILLLENSDDEDIPLVLIEWILRNLEAQGIFNVIKGIVIGKYPIDDKIEEYKQCFKKVIIDEGKHTNLPIIYNVNVGHAEPIGVFPLGLKYELNCDNKTLTLLEKATK